MIMAQIKLVKDFIFDILMLAVIAASIAITWCAMISHTGLLGRGKLGPLLGLVNDSMHLEAFALVLESLGSNVPNASNVEMLVDLLVQDLIGQVLHQGIKIARKLVYGYLCKCYTNKFFFKE